MDYDLNQFLLAVSTALDFTEIGVLGAATNHSKRVAYVSLRLAEAVGLDESERFDLCTFAILHDNGLTAEAFCGSTAERPHGDMHQLHCWLEQHKGHCEVGEENIARFPLLTDAADVIRYHHERYDGKGFFGLRRDEIPLMAQIIALADTTDVLFHFGSSEDGNRNAIRRFVVESAGTLFSPDLVHEFARLSSSVGFWLDCRDPFVDRAMREHWPGHTVELSLEEMFDVTRVLSGIVDAKSRFTYTHSDELTRKAGRMAEHYGFEEERRWKLLIAASLHDLGKLGVPNAILDKPGALTAEEFERIKTHSYYTQRALEQIDHFEEITRWASNHHEKLDGSGYYRGLGHAELGHEERLLACLDIYQALVEERPYRKAMDHTQAMSVLRQEAVDGRVEPGIVEDIDHVLAPYT